MTTTPPPKPRHQVTPTPARLYRHGRMPWDEARTLLADTTCAWADLDGFHVAPADTLPPDVPQTTHLWAWKARHCFRLRIDGRDALVAALHLDGGGDGEPVTAHARPGTPWTPENKQAGPLPQAAHTLAFGLLELTGPTPVTFVRATT
jgi:hypothetical protein